MCVWTLSLAKGWRLALRTDRPTRVLVTHHAACFSPHDGKCVCSDAFDPAQAKREGIIKPRPGVDPQHDDVGLRLIRGCLIYLPFSPVGPPPPSRPSIVHSPARPIQQAKAAIAGVKAELDAYLKEQRKRLGSNEVKYWGSKDKDRCVIEMGLRMQDDDCCYYVRLTTPQPTTNASAATSWRCPSRCSSAGSRLITRPRAPRRVAPLPHARDPPYGACRVPGALCVYGAAFSPRDDGG